MMVAWSCCLAAVLAGDMVWVMYVWCVCGYVCEEVSIFVGR